MSLASRNSLFLLVVSLLAGIAIGWYVWGRADSGTEKVELSKSQPGVAAKPAINVERHAIKSVETTLPSRATAAGETIVLPKGILRYLRADAVNTQTMNFKPDILESLGLNSEQGEALNVALKSVTANVAAFQIAHAKRKSDKEGGEYFLIQHDSSDKEALCRKLEQEIAEAIPEADPSVAGAVWRLLESSPVLQDLAYPTQELAVVNSTNFSGGKQEQPTVHLKQFDAQGNLVGAQTFLATDSLIEHRFPFLKP